MNEGLNDDVGMGRLEPVGLDRDERVHGRRLFWGAIIWSMVVLARRSGEGTTSKTDGPILNRFWLDGSPPADCVTDPARQLSRLA